ncbi:Uncharacterized protein APZ42_034253 [Daphnia magna]|uniref:Uncharacterized protein n=1 Tax=Daphnia magna TaxID=35525 RepID=A0A164KBU3_9CRUS|nr:Uncharacterized protein APZ42_034253 [Daphnia magna]
MLRQGVIEPSDSSWSSPVVLVKKKDGTWGFYVDYRKLNAVTVKFSHHLPHNAETTAEKAHQNKNEQQEESQDFSASIDPQLQAEKEVTVPENITVSPDTSDNEVITSAPDQIFSNASRKPLRNTRLLARYFTFLVPFFIFLLAPSTSSSLILRENAIFKQQADVAFSESSWTIVTDLDFGLADTATAYLKEKILQQQKVAERCKNQADMEDLELNHFEYFSQLDETFEAMNQILLGLQQLADSLDIGFSLLADGHLAPHIVSPAKFNKVIKPINGQLPRKRSISCDELLVAYRESTVSVAAMENSFRLFIHVPIFDHAQQCKLSQIINLAGATDNGTHGVLFGYLPDYLTVSVDLETFLKKYTEWHGPEVVYMGANQWVYSATKQHEIVFSCPSGGEQPPLRTTTLPPVGMFEIPLRCTAGTKEWVFPAIDIINQLLHRNAQPSLSTEMTGEQTHNLTIKTDKQKETSSIRYPYELVTAILLLALGIISLAYKSYTLIVRLAAHELYDSPPPGDSGREELEMQ